MSDTAKCPECSGEFSYQDRGLWVCPECGHEWQASDSQATVAEVLDANGNRLTSGDAVSIVKDLKIKGASGILKAGTKVKNIRVLDDEHIVDGHDIDCRIAGFGALKLKGSVVRKA